MAQTTEQVLRVQRDLAIALGGATTLDHVVRAVLDATHAVKDADASGLYLLDRATGGLALVAHRGLSPAFVAKVARYAADSARVELVARGAPVFLAAAEFAARAAYADGEGLRAFAALPIVHSGQVLGSLNVASRSTDDFPADVRQLLEAIVSQVSGALVRIGAETTYRTLVDTTGTGYVLLDSAGVVIDANEEYVRLAGRANLAEIRGHHVLEWTAPHDRERNRAEVERCFATGQVRNLEIDYIDPTGRTTPVEINATVFEAIDGKRIQTLVRDITARRAEAERLRSSVEVLRVVFENVNDGILLADLETHRLHSANRRMCELLACPPAELTSLTVDDIHPRADLAAVLAQFTRHAHGEESLAAEVPVLRRDGHVFYADVSAAPVTIAGRSYLLGTFRDVTERRAAEAERQKSERLESVGVLAGGIAHDFNNILTGITGSLSLARRSPSLDPPTAALLSEAERAANRARDLTQQLLTFARGGEPVRSLIDLGPLVRETTLFVLRGTTVCPRFAVADDLWAVEADRGQISQVLHNLLLNAVQAMPRGGSVEVSAANQVEEAAHILPPGRYVHVTVSDTGHGIPPENRERIFDPYFTTKERGTGLGLAVAYSIVRKHGGRITVDSVVGQGSQFHLLLPAATRTLAAPAPAAPAARRRLVLLMDDEELIRNVGRSMLRALGHEVTTAADGREALRLFAAAQAGGRPFDLVILDLTVPGGLGGAECLPELRRLDAKVQVVVSSGYTTSPLLAEPEAHGLAGVLSKPYGLDTLEALLLRLQEEC